MTIIISTRYFLYKNDRHLEICVKTEIREEIFQGGGGEINRRLMDSFRYAECRTCPSCLRNDFTSFGTKIPARNPIKKDKFRLNVYWIGLSLFVIN